MNVKNLTISLLLGLFVLGSAVLGANAQYINPSSGGDQVYVNQPIGAAGPGKIVAPAGMAPEAAVGANFAQQPYTYANPYLTGDGCGAPLATSCGAPSAAPCAGPVAAPVAPFGPLTGGFTYSTQQASAFGPFTPPVSQASEQFYQYPGLTPCGAYPGAGYAATGGVGFDPASGYYGPYGAYTPL